MMTLEEAGRKGGIESGKSRMELALRDIHAAIPGLSDFQARRAHAWGIKKYAAGHAAGKRLGRRAGFAEANGERDAR